MPQALIASDLSKIYKLYPSPKARLKEILRFQKKKYHEPFHALKHVSFEVGKGETLGIVGKNGSGKSTLLQIISGVMKPTSGTYAVNGKLSSLLELGAGFSPEFTGRENVYMNGALSGFTKQEIESRMSAVEEFADIGKFIDRPVKIYSSGMFIRLAFSAAINLYPDILVIDEALAVGDIYFQMKCFDVIREYRKIGVTLIIVSHDTNLIKKLCNRVILLNEGSVIKEGKPDAVLDYYSALMAKNEASPTPHHIEQVMGQSNILKTRSGTFRARITDIKLCDSKNIGKAIFKVGEEMKIIITIEFLDGIESPTIGFIIRDRTGNDIFGTNTAYLSPIIRSFKSGMRLKASFSVSLNIGIGNYSITIAVKARSAHGNEIYEWIDRAVTFQIMQGGQISFVGSSFLPVSFQTLDIRESDSSGKVGNFFRE